ncbi:hypothetical protein BDV93DRAFT_523630, partial [Ceratobasidium sp. AG-I]
MGWQPNVFTVLNVHNLSSLVACELEGTVCGRTRVAAGSFFPHRASIAYVIDSSTTRLLWTALVIRHWV